MAKKGTKGITASKNEDFSEWYTQVIQKAELIEYTDVSGCYVLRPNAFNIWEKIREYFDALIKKDGVQNAYFPLFIPEKLLTKEANHVEGFAPEVAWVEKGGNTKLQERLAVRPTSETIICDTYAKWIRSYKDLPLRLNQWCNVVRWEFKHCTPFLRSREFLWQEGHTVFATKEEAVAEQTRVLDFYEQVFSDLLAIPVLKGQKSEAEKFAGAVTTYSVEAYLPNGKAIQAATSHYLGQNFAKAYDIKFRDNDETDKFAHQNSWGISTRSIGSMIIMHSDDKGLVLPPKVARIQAVIVPILFDDSKTKVLEETKKLAKELQDLGVAVHIDDREEYSPGWKFNEWEMKGTPIRIELGPKDLEAKKAMLARRDTGEKVAVSLDKISKEVPKLLDMIHNSLYEKASTLLRENTVVVDNEKDATTQIEQGKIVLAPWCGSAESEEAFKEKTGAKSLNAPFEQPKDKKKCFLTGKDAVRWHYFGKSY